jgi:hypothetical protein
MKITNSMPETTEADNSQPIDDRRELLGAGKDDWWCYIGLILLMGGYSLDHSIVVIPLLTASSILVGIFLIRSYPRYLRGINLSPRVRIFCLVGNALIIAMQVITVSLKAWDLAKP